MVDEDGEEAGSGDGGQADGGGGQASPCFTLRLRFRLRALFGLSPFRRLHPVNVGPGCVQCILSSTRLCLQFAAMDDWTYLTVGHLQESQSWTEEFRFVKMLLI